MAKHRKPKKHTARKAVLAGAAAAGLSGTLVLGHATNTTADNVMVQLANAVVGAGGQGNPDSLRVKDKLSGKVIPDGYDFVPVAYPATIALASSRDIGVPVMEQLVTDNGSDDVVMIAGYSEGTLVAEKVRSYLYEHPDEAPSAKLTFVFIGSPFAPNGGIYNRFPGLSVPGVIDTLGPAEPTSHHTDYYANEYDVYADFPAYANPVSLLNSLFAVRYAHPDAYYDSVVPGVTPAYVTSVQNDAGGTDNYVLIYNEHIPLLGPLREISTLAGITPLTEPVLSAIEPVLRLVVDMGYTDRVNANPAAATPFSLITPPAKIVEALTGVPGALAQGATNLASGGHAVAAPPPSPNLTTVPLPSIPANPVVAPQGQSRLSLVPNSAATQEAAPARESTPTPPQPVSLPPSVSLPSGSAATSTGLSTAADDGLHPHVVSDGNKVSPGTTADGPTGTPSGSAPDVTIPAAGIPATSGGTAGAGPTPAAGTAAASSEPAKDADKDKGAA